MTARLGLRSALVLGLASLAGLVMFLWPLLVEPAQGVERVDQPFLFMALLPIVVAVVVVVGGLIWYAVSGVMRAVRRRRLKPKLRR